MHTQKLEIYLKNVFVNDESLYLSLLFYFSLLYYPVASYHPDKHENQRVKVSKSMVGIRCSQNANISPCFTNSTVMSQILIFA